MVPHGKESVEDSQPNLKEKRQRIVEQLLFWAQFS